MPLTSVSCAAAPRTPMGRRTVPVFQRTPNRAQINKLLQDFASQNPGHIITPAGFAKAIRKWAAKKQQEQENARCSTETSYQPNLGLLPSTPGKRYATYDGDDLNNNAVVSPFKKTRVNESKTSHASLGKHIITTPPRPIVGYGSHQESDGSVFASPEDQGLTPVNKRTDLTPKNNRRSSSSQNLAGSPMRRHGGTPSGQSPTPIRWQLGDDLPTFSSGLVTAQRKAAPTRLNLELPGAVPHRNINEATHYISLPVAKRNSDVDIDQLQKRIDETQANAPGTERTTLLKTPIYNLDPEDKQKELFGFVIKSIPKTPASALASTFGNKFTLATPVTAHFSAAARLRNVAAANRAQFKIAEQIGTPRATGKPTDYQADRRLRRTDRILAALNNGKGNSRPKGSPKSGRKDSSAKSTGHSQKGKTAFDFISALSRIPELAVGVAVYLPPRDVLTLYSVSVQFHIQINTYLKSSIASWVREWAPDASKVYRWDRYPNYEHFGIQDPAGRPLTLPSNSAETGDTEMNSPWQRIDRKVPSMKWYQMVTLRDDIVIDVLAHLARQGFRCPRGTKVSLLKMWMIMDLPTNAQRKALMADGETFSSQDLLNLVIFLVKLNFRLNDPIYGPETTDLAELMLGQKSLYSLWQMLFGHKYRDCVSLVQCKIRYDLGWDWHLGRNKISGMLDPKYLQPNAPAVLGVPGRQIGRVHLEYWGEKGIMHSALLRPSECIMAESARRGLRIDEHLMGLVIWGHVDQATGRNLAPTEKEIWMRDSEHKNRAIDTSTEFTPFHCRKARWSELDERGRRAILLAQEVREERVYRWDDYKYDDPDLTAEENQELNNDIRKARLERAGVDVDDPSFRVDADGNEIPPSAPAATAFVAGATTAGLQKAEAYVDDGGYDTDSSVDSLEATMTVNDTSKVQYVWKPEEEDHAIHIPRRAPTTSSPQTQDSGLGNIYDINSEEDTDREDDVDGDVPFQSDEDIEYDNIWDMWEEMEPKVFRTIFEPGSDDGMV